jgi:hypothetical protein
MSVSQMRAEDRLVEASNWSPWKTRLIFVLQDLELWDTVQALIVIPIVIVPVLVAEFGKRNNKEKRIAYDAVRDHVIPHLTGKDYDFEMWASLCKLYQSPNQNLKMVMQEKLRSIQMLKTDLVTSYLGRFTKIRDELAAVGEIVDPNFMVRASLNNFPNPGIHLFKALLPGRL